jgi:hypothetical protein
MTAMSPRASEATAGGLVFIGGAFDRDQAEVVAAFALPDGGTR